LRFLLGVADSGLTPGLVFFLTFWYRAHERSLRIALFFASASLSGAIGGLIAYAIGHMNGVGGLSAWRWLFILEGTGSCVFALLVWYSMPDYPECSPWLSAEEKELAEKRLRVEGSKGSSPGLTWKDAKSTLTDWRLYGHYLVCLFFSASLPFSGGGSCYNLCHIQFLYLGRTNKDQIAFAIACPFSSLSLFLPSLTASLGYSDLQTQVMTIPPNATAYVVSVIAAWSADHYNAYELHIIHFVNWILILISLKPWSPYRRILLNRRNGVYCVCTIAT
jgi:MFS family permease